jgi:hypothetical protein
MVELLGANRCQQIIYKSRGQRTIINSLTPREKGEVVIEAVVSEAGVILLVHSLVGGHSSLLKAAYPGLSSKIS